MKQQAGAGITFALITAMSWGSLPIAMKTLLTVMDPFTIVFYRFLFACVGLGLFLAIKRRLPPVQTLKKPRWMLLIVVATAGLLGNFVMFSSSLQYLSPTASQVIAQIAPQGMMLASVLILKERMRGSQVAGAIMLMCGLVLFFNTNLIEIFTRLTEYTLGVMLGVGAACVWIVYGVTQKVLLRRMASQQILFLLYTLCTVVLAFLATPGQVHMLTGAQMLCLLYCGVNTLIGYGALAEAYARWQAAQVSALITLTPLFTLLFSVILAWGWPDTFDVPVLNTLGYVGAIVVVAGAMFSAIGHKLLPRRRQPVTE
ncbi:EamA family transporter [Enterobacterales bacterium CwR94]|nr:EamA family transporter [Enterobacterales bacterium CwR94]